MDFGIGLKIDYDVATATRVIQDLEAKHFSTLWFPDERFFMDGFSMMGLAALSTKKIAIGAAVTDPFVRHPALTATISATVDAISGSRVILGIGAGSSGFAQMGLERKRPALAIREMVELIRRLQSGEKVTYSGETVKVKGAKLDFKAARRVPIYVAGRGSKILQLGGEVGDGVIVGALASPKGLEYAFGNIRKGAERGNRKLEDVKKVLWIHTCISRDGAAARRAIGGMIAYIIHSGGDLITELGVPEDVAEAVRAGVKTKLGGVPSYTGFKQLANLIPDDISDTFSIAGTPDQVSERIAGLQKQGYDQIAFNPYLLEGMNIREFVDMLGDRVVDSFS